MIKYYYVIYLKRNDKIEIHAIPFDTREEAKAYKEKADAFFSKRGQLEYSKVLKRDLSKYNDPHWL